MKLNHYVCLFAALMLIFSVSAYAVEKERIDQTPADVTKPTESWYSAPLDRLGSGVGNIVYGPLELIYQTKEEIKRTDPVRGMVPGIIRGVTWFGKREVIGVFEVVTFFLPIQPHLEPFNTNWLHV